MNKEINNILSNSYEQITIYDEVNKKELITITNSLVTINNSDLLVHLKPKNS